MNVNMDTAALPFNQPAVSSTAPPRPTISSATATATAATTTTTHPSNPLLFSSSSASTSNNPPTLNPNPHHAPADPLQHLQMPKEHTETASAPAPGAAESQAPAPALQSSSTNYYPHQIEGAGGPTATAPFLRDFSLVAEAAKRAQMSVVMRDLESVTL